MDFKFIVLALVISVATGEEVAKKLESSRANTAYTSSSTNRNENLLNEQGESIPKIPEEVAHDVNSVPIEISNDDLSHKDIKLDKTNSTGSNADISGNSTSDNSTTISTTSTSTTTTTTAPTTPATTLGAIPITVKTGPEEGTWKVLNKTNVCIAVQMGIEFNVTYQGKNNVANSTIVQVPKNANASGNCGNEIQDILLTWGSGNIFQISFSRNDTTGKFEISALNVTVNTTNFPNIKDGVGNLTYSKTKPNLPPVPLKMSYKCDRQMTLILNNSQSQNFNATLFISHTQFEAFMDRNNETAFGEAKDCDDFDTPDIVPTVVGSVLGVLVLVVLAAYLIGRRKSQNRGYLSM